MPVQEDKLELITKLLAKAESTTPEEAEALTEHAERLMVKYGIEQARLDAKRAQLGGSREEIIQERMLFTGVYARDIREFGASIGLALGTTRAMYSEAATGMILYLIGFASDVQQTKLLTSSLEVQAMIAMRTWWKRERARYEWHSEGEKRRARSGFIRGFGIGAAERIRESRATIVEEGGTGTELVLASRRDEVDAFVDRIPSKRARTRRGTDPSAFMHGRRSGREANTGGQAVRA
ncbi:DUF2786 domain-containing protein [Microbacterium sp.]|uniref:DUF2786 domain-containing protein n=1 Tax=Microbacterium sp. TaxID=51671 RepID=UPI003F9E4039